MREARPGTESAADTCREALDDEQGDTKCRGGMGARTDSSSSSRSLSILNPRNPVCMRTGAPSLSFVLLHHTTPHHTSTRVSHRGHRRSRRGSAPPLGINLAMNVVRRLARALFQPPPVRQCLARDQATKVVYVAVELDVGAPIGVRGKHTQPRATLRRRKHHSVPNEGLVTLVRRQEINELGIGFECDFWPCSRRCTWWQFLHIEAANALIGCNIIIDATTARQTWYTVSETRRGNCRHRHDMNVPPA